MVAVYKLRQEYLISYDIEDNKIRTQLYKALLGYGLRAVQKSVFWGYLSAAELAAVRRDLQTRLKTTDKAFITRSNFNSRGNSYYMGHSTEDFTDWQESGVI